MATVDARDSQASVSVDLGESVVIRLDENPTTGYRWALDHLDSQVLEPDGTAFQPKPDAAIGAGGLRTFVFRAKNRGIATIGLKLWREWQGPNSVIERRNVTVRIG